MDELADLVASMPTDDGPEHTGDPGGGSGVDFGDWHAACEEAIVALWEASDGQDADTLSALVGRLADMIATVPSQLGGQLALISGAFVENGADPLPLVQPFFQALLPVLADCADLIDTWPQPDATSQVDERPDLDEEPDEEPDGDGPRPPDPYEEGGMQKAYGTLILEVGKEAAFRIAMSWFSVRNWQQAATALLQVRAVRDMLPDREELIAAVEAVRQWRGDLNFLAALLRVLDDEPIIVLHRASGRGWRIRIAGIADIFQLHTLLAAHLIGPEHDGLIPGDPPTPAQIAAATDGEPRADMDGRFNLVDATGAWIFNEGIPADIPMLDDRRVIVLDPQPYGRVWNAGRSFPRMRPSLVVEKTLSTAEAAEWLIKVAPPDTYSGAYTI